MAEKTFVKVRHSNPTCGTPDEKIEVTGVLKNRLKTNGARRMKLNRAERQELALSARVESAVAFFLDLEHERSLKEIADEMGISVNSLKDITKMPEFMDAYNEHFMELGHDPRLRATQAALVDMLPQAVKQLKQLITDLDTPAPTRLGAIRELFRMVGVEAPKSQNERNELAEFLKDHNLTLNQININPPTRPETIDAVVKEVTE